jgi:hypothetical protein
VILAYSLNLKKGKTGKYLLVVEMIFGTVYIISNGIHFPKFHTDSTSEKIRFVCFNIMHNELFVLATALYNGIFILRNLVPLGPSKAVIYPPSEL